MIFKDYEMAAISLNLFNGVILEDIHYLGNNNKVLVLSTFSSLRNLDYFVNIALKITGNDELNSKLAISRIAQQQIYYSIFSKSKTMISSVDKQLYRDIWSNFWNYSGMVDGNISTLNFTNNNINLLENYKSNGLYLH